MQVQFGNQRYEYPSANLGELRASNDLLHQPEGLRQRLQTDGYLLLRQLISRDKVLAARQTILNYMAENQGLEPGSRPLDGVMGQYGKSVRMMGRKGITHHPVVKSELESEELFAFYQNLFGETIRTFDYKWLRAVGIEEFTGAHYDVVYMGNGSKNLLTCWIPLGDIELEQGVLAICEGSHQAPGFEKLRQTYGRMDVDRDRMDHGWFSKDPQEIIDRFGGQWKTTAFRAGDMLTFGMFTLHASTTNTTDRWRLSCDVRFQPLSDPADPRWVGDDPSGHLPAGQAPHKTMAAARHEWGV